ncbi:nitrate reductase molybdenum cofactor assembly chaperone [Teredinibacter haidensis]|uniref:nitrate reductase molybdenum cofactor assembly chaperone n=1 Tax=Teredinibacter haidensis TaxID=2731755 RepID=UPI000948DE9D|nr:nitrate reductase molybdenum cofactor assembly chaperone [Teredinibacter haidensis]
MDVLLVISRLLDYPDESLCECHQEMGGIVSDSPLNTDTKEKVQAFISHQVDRNLLDWQSEYDGLFERGRSLGLWLFEHVHGESRDRGQAMVDLLNQYKQAGLEIAKHELPDYIPLFLEFISTQGETNAKSWLQEVEHILALLQARLEKRGSSYSVLFEALLEVAASDLNLSKVREAIDAEIRDDTKEALDKEWQEEEVTFGAESMQENCSSASRKPSDSQMADLEAPVHWVDFDQTQTATTQSTFREGNS